MTQPSVTVVIPTHNRPVELRRAVQSVVDQNYDGRIEIIVVFDASAIELPDVAVDARIDLRGIANYRRRGLAGARNSGILTARYPFVAFLDDDDYWLAHKLEYQMAVFAARPGTILVGTAMRVIGSAADHDRLLPFDTVRHPDLVRDRLAALHSSSLLFRRSALTGALGLVDEDLPRSYGEDYDMLLRAAQIAPIEVVNLPLVAVTWLGQSYFFGRWAIYASALQYLLAKHPQFAEDRRAVGRIESQVAFALAAGGDAPQARIWARRALGHDVLQLKAALALAISLRLVSADRVVRTARRLGKGI